MQEFHVLVETPTNSGNYIESGEVLGGSADDAALRCVALSLENGGRYGFWVHETVAAVNLASALPPAPEDILQEATVEPVVAVQLAAELAAANPEPIVAEGQEHAATLEGDQPVAIHE